AACAGPAGTRGAVHPGASFSGYLARHFRTAATAGFPRVGARLSDWHQKYKERYARLKSAGKSFFPYAIFKDTLVAFLILGVVLALAHFWGAKLEDLADPTDTTYNPRPEWYFLFLFQALKFFPGKWEAV